MKALIFGVTGQDGSYLSELLLSKGYEVHGVIRRSSSFNTWRIDHLDQSDEGKFRLHYGDLLDGSRVRSLMTEIQPDEVYNLGAQSHVKVSFEIPGYTLDTIVTGTLNVLEALRCVPKCRMYQASSSEMFGNSPPPQSESTPFSPRSPYACAKVAAHHLCQNYREAYKLFVSCGILFNHESPRRGESFVTRKVTKAAVRIKHGLQSELVLGNLDARRDWGYAGDYVRAMWMMLQADRPDDYVVATGVSHSVRDLLQETFGRLGLDWGDYVVVDPKYRRPTEVDDLRGDFTKIHRELGWAPKVGFEELVGIMLDHDLADVTGGGN